MLSINSNVPRVLRSVMLAAAGFASFSTPISNSALAQDCKLGVIASPQIVNAGQSAQVNVFAHFPAPPAPGGAHAFASSQFDVYSTHPMWSFVSSGAIVGDDVLGMNVSQANMPWAGIFADPSNPYRVWRGTFKPTSSAPALVQFTADPMTFSVYPSQLTSSSMPREAEAGSDWVLVNPLKAGAWRVAPGAGTTVHVSDDVVVDGTIITGENWPTAGTGPIQIGMLHPAIQKVRASSTRVAFDGEPVTFTATVQVQEDAAPQRSRVTSFAITFDRPIDPNTAHFGGINVIMGDGSVRFTPFGAYLGGVYVASGEIGGDEPGSVPGLMVESLPQVIGAQIPTGTVTFHVDNTYTGMTMVLEYDEPVLAMVRSSNGHLIPVMLDRIEVYGADEDGPPNTAAATNSAQLARSANNLKQLGLGCHVFEATGVSRMTIKPLQPH